MDEFGSFSQPMPSDDNDNKKSADRGSPEPEKRHYSKKEYLDALEPLKDYAKSGYVSSIEAETAPRLHCEFLGILESERPREKTKRFIDEFVSSFRGEAFVHTRAVGSRRSTLRSENGISAYMVSVGPFRGRTSDMRINVPFIRRAIVKEIHDKVFQRVIFFSDKMEEWKDYEEVLREIKNEYSGDNDMQSAKPFIELLF